MGTKEQVRESLLLLFRDAGERQMWDITEIYGMACMRLGNEILAEKLNILMHQRKSP